MKSAFRLRAPAIPVVAGIAACLVLTGAASAQTAAGKPSTPSANAAARSAAHHGAGATAPPANAVARSLGVAGPAAVPAPPIGLAPHGSPAPSPAAATPNAMGTMHAPPAASGTQNAVTGTVISRTPTPSPTGPIIFIPTTPPAP
jgi:hypothetical protein